MRKLPVIFFLLLTVSLHAQSDLVARVHFLGGDPIAADPNSRPFTNEFCTPEARAFGGHVLDKISHVAAGWFGSDNNSALLRPLFDDLGTSEWILEIKDGAHPEYALAIRLSSDRAQAWSKNLQAVAQNWSGLAVAQPDKAASWEAKKASGGSIGFSQAAGWAIVDIGPALTLRESIVPAHAETNWLAVDANWPRLGQLFPALQQLDLPKFSFHVDARDGYFLLAGKLNLSQPLTIEPWRIPTNFIHQPFIGFTAARGIGPWLSQQPWFRPYLLQPQPNQVFVWTLPQIPFQTFFAEPVPHASSALAGLEQGLSGNAAWKNQFIAPMTLSLTNDRLSMAGFPFFSPFAQVVHEADGDFLAGGFFPNTARGKAMPPELLEQLKAPGLVYYQWELAGPRFKNVHQTMQLLLMLTGRQQLEGKSPAYQWIARFEPELADSVTIATQVSPTELAITRKSKGGLTAFELLLLANWVESPRFPSTDLHQAEHMRLGPPKRPAAPPPVPMK